jgi:hypothetical protein
MKQGRITDDKQIMEACWKEKGMDAEKGARMGLVFSLKRGAVALPSIRKR